MCPINGIAAFLRTDGVEKNTLYTYSVELQIRSVIKGDPEATGSLKMTVRRKRYP